MKIKATCNYCDKDLLLEQAVTAGGHCPWCGESFQRDYAVVLTDAIKAAEASGQVLENALEKMAELRPGFKVDRSFMAEITGSVGQLV